MVSIQLNIGMWDTYSDTSFHCQSA